MPEPVVTAVDEPGIRGFLHAPIAEPVGALALTHGAGGNCTAKLLVDVADTWAANGFAVLRFDLAFRLAKPSGPPHPSKSGSDRDSVRAAAEYLGTRVSAPLFVGGHSYGGRQASMAAAADSELADGLVLLSYPLHPPGKPDKARTAHLPDIATPVLFVSGTKDPFGTPDELRTAVALVPSNTELVEITGAGHDLSAAKYRTAVRALEAASALFSIQVPTHSAQ